MRHCFNRPRPPRHSIDSQICSPAATSGIIRCNIPRGTIDKLISGAGGNLNASTSFDQTDYFFNVPENQLKLALWIESERMLHAKIDETGVETQRKVVKEEKRCAVLDVWIPHL